jgi:hypothetical protein
LKKRNRKIALGPVKADKKKFSCAGVFYGDFYLTRPRTSARSAHTRTAASTCVFGAEKVAFFRTI